MDLPVNALKHALAAGRPQFGLWCSLPSSYATEVVASAGFDFLCLDTEHSPNELDTVVTQLQAAAPYPVSVGVRPAWNDMVLIKRLLDVGVQTLVIPYVQNADEAQRAVSSTRYPPDGVRGVAGSTRASRFGRVSDYARRAHEELCVVVQIETPQAIEHLDEIAAVEGVDALFIGPADLHTSLGHPGETEHPDVVPVIERAIARIRAAGKAPGILHSNDTLIRRFVDAGCLMVAVGLDVAMLARSADALSARYTSRS